MLIRPGSFLSHRRRSGGSVSPLAALNAIYTNGALEIKSGNGLDIPYTLAATPFVAIDSTHAQLMFSPGGVTGTGGAAQSNSGTPYAILRSADSVHEIQMTVAVGGPQIAIDALPIVIGNFYAIQGVLAIYNATAYTVTPATATPNAGSTIPVVFQRVAGSTPVPGNGPTGSLSLSVSGGGYSLNNSTGTRGPDGSYTAQLTCPAGLGATCTVTVVDEDGLTGTSATITTIANYAVILPINTYGLVGARMSNVESASRIGISGRILGAFLQSSIDAAILDVWNHDTVLVPAYDQLRLISQGLGGNNRNFGPWHYQTGVSALLSYDKTTINPANFYKFAIWVDMTQPTGQSIGAILTLDDGVTNVGLSPCYNTDSAGFRVATTPDNSGASANSTITIGASGVQIELDYFAIWLGKPAHVNTPTMADVANGLLHAWQFNNDAHDMVGGPDIVYTDGGTAHSYTPVI